MCFKKTLNAKRLLVFSFLVSILFTLLVSTRFKNIQIYFENSSAGNCRSVIPTFRKFQKALFILNFREVEKNFSPKIVYNFSSRSQWNFFTYKRVLERKINDFILCITILIRRKCEKMPMVL